MQTTETHHQRQAGDTAALLEHLDIEARTRSQRLEDTDRLPLGFTDHYYPLTPREQAIARRYRAAFTLADDIDVCRALLNGERIPRHRLNQPMLAAHERRRRGR